VSFAEDAKKEPVSKNVKEFLAKAKKQTLYPQCSKNPLPIQQEDYKKNYMALRGLTGIYVNIDDIIKGAETRKIILSKDIKQTVINKLKIAGMTLLNKEDIKLVLGQPELNVFAAYPKHLGPFKEGQPVVQYNRGCCLASTWTSFAQGARVLRDPKTNYRLSTWGEGHSTSDCSNLTEWYQGTVIKTIENFIETKVKADSEYEKEQKKALLPKVAKPAKNLTNQSKLEIKKPNEKKDQKTKNDKNKEASQKHNTTKVGVTSKVEIKTNIKPSKTISASKTPKLEDKSSCGIVTPEYLELFDSDESAISESKVGGLDKVIKVIKDCTHYNFIVETHSDSRSEIEYNKRLSLERADTLTSYLLKKGVHQSRFTTQAFGETKPILKGNSAAVHMTNRRVVIKPILIDEHINSEK